jgi:hypothetical protein
MVSERSSSTRRRRKVLRALCWSQTLFLDPTLVASIRNTSLGHPSTFLISHIFLYDVHDCGLRLYPSSSIHSPLNNCILWGLSDILQRARYYERVPRSISALPRRWGDLVQAGKHHGDVLGFELMGRHWGVGTYTGDGSQRSWEACRGGNTSCVSESRQQGRKRRKDTQGESEGGSFSLVFVLLQISFVQHRRYRLFLLALIMHSIFSISTVLRCIIHPRLLGNTHCRHFLYIPVSWRKIP